MDIMSKLTYITYLITKRLSSSQKKLMDDFIVLDKRGVKWTAPKGTKTDGKSVPKWLTPVIGDPFEGVTEPAAVIHDNYCVLKNRSQKDTHRIFREMIIHEMRKSKPWFTRWFWHYERAWMMWSAVRAFNKIKHPQWK